MQYLTYFKNGFASFSEGMKKYIFLDAKGTHNAFWWAAVNLP